MYYWELCEVLYLFRKENGLSPAELWSFLYDFAPNNLPSKKIDIPKPSQVWLIGGRLCQEDKSLESKFWQSSPDTKKGDILVHYETSPISAVTCIEISLTDGVIDPLFRYYGCIYIGNRIAIPHITLKEFREDEYFSSHPLIRKNFQGVNGWSMSSEDYSELLRMIKAKGFDIDTLPKLYTPTRPKNVSIEKEEMWNYNYWNHCLTLWDGMRTKTSFVNYQYMQDVDTGYFPTMLCITIISQTKKKQRF